jgi:hypothetical protein
VVGAGKIAMFILLKNWLNNDERLLAFLRRNPAKKY